MKYYYDHQSERHEHHFLKNVLIGFLAIALGAILAVINEKIFGTTDGFTLFAALR